MIAHAKRAHLTLSTTVKKTVIIGGEEDFCAERCGYKQDKSGIEAYFAPVPVTPSYNLPIFCPLWGLQSSLTDTVSFINGTPPSLPL